MVDPTNEIKSDFLLNVLADDPVFMVPTVVDSYGARAPMKLRLTLYDQYTNEVTWFNGAFTLSMKYRADNAVYTNFTVMGGAMFSNGRHQGSTVVGPYVRDPGDFVMTFTLVTNTNITTNFNVKITLNGDETALSLGNNYITPGNPIRFVEIFGQNKNTETIPVIVTVYDSSGRRVKEFAPQNLVTGFTSLLPWDLKNTAGKQVSAGLYLIRIQPENSAKQNILPPTTKKVVIVR